MSIDYYRKIEDEMTPIIFPNTVYKYIAKSHNHENDHTNMTAPLPVRSAKLSMFGPG
jgi:hypothetical protein